MKKSSLMNTGAIWVLAAVVMAPVAHAEDFVVDTMTTETNGDNATTIDGDDSLLVTETGSITANGDGIDASGPNNVITNNGSVASMSDGIRSSGDNATITNAGALGGVSNGIDVDGDDNVIVNTGTVSGVDGTAIETIGEGNSIANSGTVSSGNDIAIFADGTDASVTNSGLISFAGSDGIVVDGENARITNSGEVNANDRGIVTLDTNSSIDNSGEIISGGNAIVALGPSASVTNSGTLTAGGTGISTTGNNSVVTNSGTIIAPNSNGVFLGGTGSMLTNTGVIFASGNSAVFTNGDNAVVINDGAIVTDVGLNAIFMTGANSQLVLEAGSTLRGGIGFSDAQSGVLDVGLPHAVLSFNGDIPGTVDTGDSASAEIGNVLIVVDPQGFGAVAEGAGQITGGVNDLVAAQRGYVYGFGLSTDNADRMSFIQTNPEPHRSTRGVWATGGLQGGSSDASDTSSGTWLLGGHYRLTNGTYVDIYGGQVIRNITTDYDADDIDSETTLLGASWGGATTFGFFDLGLIFGQSAHDGTRQIANNLVVDGYEEATSDYDSSFISPSLTVGTQTVWGGTTVTPSLRVGYTIHQMDGYEETGSSAPLTVEDRTVTTADLRAQVGMALAPTTTNAGNWNVSYAGGLQALQTDGDALDISAINQSIPQIETDDAFDLAIFGTARAALDLRNGSEFFVDGGFAAGNNDQRGIQIGIGFSRSF